MACINDTLLSCVFRQHLEARMCMTEARDFCKNENHTLPHQCVSHYPPFSQQTVGWNGLLILCFGLAPQLNPSLSWTCVGERPAWRWAGIGFRRSRVSLCPSLWKITSSTSDWHQQSGPRRQNHCTWHVWPKGHGEPPRRAPKLCKSWISEGVERKKVNEPRHSITAPGSFGSTDTFFSSIPLLTGNKWLMMVPTARIQSSDSTVAPLPLGGGNETLHPESTRILEAFLSKLATISLLLDTTVCIHGLRSTGWRLQSLMSWRLLTLSF